MQNLTINGLETIVVPTLLGKGAVMAAGGTKAGRTLMGKVEVQEGVWQQPNLPHIIPHQTPSIHQILLHYLQIISSLHAQLLKLGLPFELIEPLLACAFRLSLCQYLAPCLRVRSIHAQDAQSRLLMHLYWR